MPAADQRYAILVFCLAMICPAIVHAQGRLLGLNDSFVFDIDRTTGETQPVSDVVLGLGGIRRASALARHPVSGLYYCADDASDQLFTVNATSGAIDRIGRLDPYGITGLTFDANTGTLYGLASFPSQLVTLDPLTAETTSEIPLSPPRNVAGLAFDATTNTLFGININTDSLITINTATGVMTTIGPTGVSEAASLALDPATGNLFTVHRVFGELFRIDRTTGAGTKVADTGVNSIRGMTYDPGTQMLIGATDRFSNTPTHLVHIDPSSAETSVSTALGYTQVRGLAFDEDKDVLYATDSVGQNLGTIDTKTGNFSLIGSFGDVRPSPIRGLAFDRAQRILWGLSNNVIYRIDQETGKATEIKLRNGIDMTIDPQTGFGYFISSGSAELRRQVLPTGPSISIGPTGLGFVTALTFDCDESVILAIDNTAKTLVEIDPATASSTVVGSLGFGSISVSGLTYDCVRRRLYATSEQGHLFVLDRSTGRATSVGSTGLFFVSGATVNPSTQHVLIADSSSQALWSMNPVTMESTAIARIDVPFVGGLAFDLAGNVLYIPSLTGMVDLFAIDPVSGASTLIGPTSEFLGALAWNSASGILFGIASDGLFEIDTNSGAATLVGSALVPGGGGPIIALAIDSATQDIFINEKRNQTLIHVDLMNSPPSNIVGRMSHEADAMVVLPTFCGDGSVNAAAGEECDDGNNTNGDGCDLNCIVETCGNGVIQINEDCDDGNDIPGDGCDNCVGERCSNGIVNFGEECDDGNLVSGDGCTFRCTTEFCGDGVVNNSGSEACDDGGESATCDADCTPPECGDGTLNKLAGETCDDGNTIDGDGCNASCTVEFCGDGMVNDGSNEECDDGNNVDGDGCNATCATEFCGDGVVNNSGIEQCDDGNTIDGDGCDATCAVEFCGDGTVNDSGSEQCDDGNMMDGDGCTAACVIEFCGDGVTNNAGTEACDDGANNSDTQPDACRTDCSQPTCGDNVIDSGEQCDDGAANANAPDACRFNCSLPICGDGIVDNGEACDVGGSSADCDDDCTLPQCGDGDVNTQAGEACDDSGPSATCNPDCTLSLCGDGQLNILAGEQCDDGNNTDGDGCSATCEIGTGIPVPATTPTGMLILMALLGTALALHARPVPNEFT